MNQIGGVGAVGAGNGSRTFNNTADGVKDCVSGNTSLKFDGTCKPCTNRDKCCYELTVSAKANKEQTYELVTFKCGDDEELFLNIDMFYDATNTEHKDYKMS